MCINDHIDTDAKVRDNRHITGKYRGSAQKDCNSYVQLNHKTPLVFQHLKDYNSHLIIEELDKLNLKINVIPNGLDKYVNLTIKKKLNFTERFQLLSSSLHGLVKNLDQDDFKHLSQKFDNKVLDLVKKNRFHLYEYMKTKQKFYNSLICKKNCSKKYDQEHDKNILFIMKT